MLEFGDKSELIAIVNMNSMNTITVISYNNSYKLSKYFHCNY